MLHLFQMKRNTVIFHSVGHIPVRFSREKFHFFPGAKFRADVYVSSHWQRKFRYINRHKTDPTSFEMFVIYYINVDVVIEQGF